jgi:hypothetical protein
MSQPTEQFQPRLGDTTPTEWGVLRRSDTGHILYATMYETEDDARANATPQDSVEHRTVGPWES